MQSQSDQSASRVCSRCSRLGPPDIMFPTGWIITPVYEPAGPGFTPIMVGERATCLDCQHPELGHNPMAVLP